MLEIKDHVETFKINGSLIKVGISIINGTWYCSTLEGNTSVAGFEGGEFTSLEAYIKAMKTQYEKEDKHFIKSGEAAKHILRAEVKSIQESNQ